MRTHRLAAACALLLALPPAAPAQKSNDFAESIRPILAANCMACHNPANPKLRVNFLKAQTAKDVESARGLWRDVATQLRNRTMPPGDAKITEDDRLRVAQWIDQDLRQSACDAGPFAGAIAIRRLNRREYHNTIRDLLGVDYNVSDLFPVDGTGGAGFDTNGETLYVPPLLLERYLEAARQILDRVIVTPPLSKLIAAPDLLPAVATSGVRELAPGAALAAPVNIYADGDYNLRVTLQPATKDAAAANMGALTLKIDDAPTGVPMKRGTNPRPFKAAPDPLPNSTLTVHLTRGLHQLTITAETAAVPVLNFAIDQRPVKPAPEKLALHYRLLGVEPGEEPVQARRAAEQTFRTFLRKAYRHPIETADLAPLLTLYDRAAQRGDPFEERMKLALEAALVGPQFLFKIEQRADKPGIFPIGQFELASRLSYFLWSTMPDDELNLLAAQGRLQDPQVLAAQVDRMLDDPRSDVFASTFIGQWLGTQDLGGKVAPMLTELQDFYTPPVAADLRAEPVLIFERILGENRSLLELLTGNYTYLTDRTVKFYQLEGKLKDFKPTSQPQLVEWPDDRRAGIMNLGSIMAINAHFKQTSPVLRGAWILDTLLGTPIPPPPPNIPPLADGPKAKLGVGMRQKTLAHRANPACAACHKLMDPMGFALEHFDWTGRWRDTESDGSPIDATGELPSGEKFDGAIQLRQLILSRKDDFLRQVSGKVLGYALGRSLQDGDSCTVAHLADALRKDNYRARTLIREVILSVPLRNSQGGKITMEAAAPAPAKRAVPMVVK